MLKTIIIGHIGQDAKTSQYEGKDVANFSVAHSFKRKDGSEQTVWLDCSLWETPNVHPYLLKGQQVYLEGTPGVRTYQAQDSTIKPVMTLQVHTLQLLGSAKKENENGGGGAQENGNDDLPM